MLHFVNIHSFQRGTEKIPNVELKFNYFIQQNAITHSSYLHQPLKLTHKHSFPIALNAQRYYQGVYFT